MAHILSQNPIAYTIDRIKIESHALVVAKKGNEIDCTTAAAVSGFAIDYSQPEGTRIALAFSTGDEINQDQINNGGNVGGGGSDNSTEGAWFRVNAYGGAVLIAEQNLTYESLIDDGNTIEDLTSLDLENICAFTGYKVRVAVALLTEDPENAKPYIKLGLKCKYTQQTTQKIEYSPIYELGDDAQIINIIPKTDSSQDATVKVEACANDSGVWLPLENFIGIKANNIQLKATLTAPVINSSTAKLTETSIIYTQGEGIISGSGVSEIVSKTHNWYRPVRHCRILVSHEPLKDSNMKVYCSMRPIVKRTEGEVLGTGDGKQHTYQLKNKSRINFSSVKLYFDGVQTFGNYEVNGEVARITCTAPIGVIITCDYEYNYALEQWQELELTGTIRKDTHDESSYYLRTNEAGYICAVKIAFHMTTGHINDESIGTGKGKEYSYKLSKHINDGNITISAGGANLSKSNYYILEDSQYVRAAAPNGANLSASYDWISKTPTVYNFHAVFSE